MIFVSSSSTVTTVTSPGLLLVLPLCSTIYAATPKLSYLDSKREITSLDSEYLIVMDVFQSVADHTDSHVDQIGRGHLEHLLGELLTVLVDLLSSNTSKLLISMTNYIQEDTSLLHWTQMTNMSLKAKL